MHEPLLMKCRACGYLYRGAVCNLCKQKSLLAKVERVTESGCWIWMGCVNENGYGRVGAGNFQTNGSKTISAHRLSWRLFVGDIPAGMHLCHRCDVPSCVNPSHLFIGTPRDNIHDAIRKGRARRGKLRGEAHGRALLTERDVIEILVTPGSARLVSEKYGVSQGAIEQIRRGKNWTHIPRPSAEQKAAYPQLLEAA